MNRKAKSAKMKAGAYVGLIAGLLAVVSLIVYLIYAASAEGLMIPWVPVCLVLAVVCEAVLFFFENDYLPILAAGFSATALGFFLLNPPETIGSVVDYFQNIVMFGNPENFGIIISLTVLMVLLIILAVIRCFSRQQKDYQA